MAPIDFPVPPVRKVVIFKGPIERAFDRFTRDIGAWWPLATHSLGGATQAMSAEFERMQIGGRLVERWRDGQIRVWGTLVDLEPPRRIGFTWHVGREADAAQLIEVVFTPIGEAETEVRLTHSGWERLGVSGPQTRDRYDEGWNGVLTLYVQTAQAS